MAGPWFTRSGAAGAGTGADWANAFTTLTAANTASTAGGGETFWIADDHHEITAGAVTLTTKGTDATPNFYYVVDHTVASPGTGNLASGAIIETTGANAITLAGPSAYFKSSSAGGLAIQSGSGAVNTALVINSVSLYLDGVLLEKRGTTTNAAAITMNSASYLLWQNTQVKFGATGDQIRLGPKLIWTNTASAVQGATVPAVLFQLGNALGGSRISGVDLSAVTGQIFGGTNPRYDVLERCKVAAGVVFTVAPVRPERLVDVIQCDSGATTYVQSRIAYQGTLTQETTIVRSGGASDGTTPLSWKIVSTANSNWVSPFESFPIAIWNDTVGSSVTATVEIVAAGALNNDDVWMEVEYLGSASTPQASFVNSTKANNLATGSALTASGATWASSPGNAQKLSVSFTPQMKGLIYIRVFVAKASQTLYVDPRPSFNGIPVRRSYISINGVYMAEPAVSRPGLHPIEMGIAA